MSRAFYSPAASLAALAKFLVSMQAMSSLLSSTVFLRTRAGFPFPHFGKPRLRAALRERDRKLMVRAIVCLTNAPEKLNTPISLKSCSQSAKALFSTNLMDLNNIETVSTQKVRGI